MSEILKIYKRILYPAQKRACVGLLSLMFLGSLLECLGLSLIIPAIAALSDCGGIQNFGFLQLIIGNKLSGNSASAVANVVLLISGVYLLKNLFLAVAGYIQISFIGKTRLAVRKEIIDGTLKSPYINHIQIGTPELMQRLDSDIQGTFRLLDKLISMCSEGMLILVLAVVLAMVNLPMVLAVLGLYGVILFCVQSVLKPYMRKESIKDYQKRQNFMRWLLQTVSCIKIIKGENLEGYFSDKLKQTAAEAEEVEVHNTFIQMLPRLIMEAISICGMLGIASIFIRNGGETTLVLNQLTIFALGAIRMLPCVSRISGCVNSLNWNRPLLERTANVLVMLRKSDLTAQEGQKIPETRGEEVFGQDECTFVQWHKLELENVCFRYPDTEELVLEDLNLAIYSGQMLGIIGLSGEGKTTLVDIMLGLLEPQKGCVRIDGKNLYETSDGLKSWSSHVAYIPQNVSMLDGTIRENILFGRADKGDDKIWSALEEAQLADYVRSLPAGLETYVGEYGLRFSGGQRQRLGLARVFYKQADILVMDEATSALDYETEQKIMQMLGEQKGKRTMLIITHRLEALSLCDKVISVSHGKAKEWSQKT